jgi:hypothetical protein
MDLVDKLLGLNVEPSHTNVEEERMYRLKYEEKCEEVIRLQKTIIELTSSKVVKFIGRVFLTLGADLFEYLHLPVQGLPRKRISTQLGGIDLKCHYGNPKKKI